METTTKTVTIPEDTYEELLDDSQFLDALKAAGVDNWDGYEVAHEILKEWQGE